MNPPKGKVVDHKDHDTLNCKRNNLRVCTYAQNSANMLPKEGGKSKYKGVTINASGAYQTSITHHYVPMYLGSFKSEKKAARFYDKAALHLKGEFAYTNFDYTIKKNRDKLKKIVVPYVDCDPPRAEGTPSRQYKRKKNPFEDAWKARRESIKPTVKLKTLKSGKTIVKIAIQGKHGKDEDGKQIYAKTDKKYYDLIKDYKWYGKVPYRYTDKFIH